jgi:crotonobetainyl-CoA:carnitine CoA-transferase CaiB-like acyl-CoA transferase
VSSPPRAALAGLRVLDVSGGIAGQYCSKLLAGYGADCILVEPSGGTATRRLGPCVPGDRSSTRSALFRHLNQGKTSVVCGPAGDGLRALAALADVVIRDQATAMPLSLPVTAIECVIGEFPQDGAYSGWQGTEMVHQAISGTMFMTGRPDRRPLYGVGHRAYYACGTTAFVSVMSALHERASSGLGQTVTATVFEANAAIAQNLVSQYSYNGSCETRRQYPGFLALLECQDHWMVLFAIRHWERLCEVFGLDDLLTDERLADQASRLEHWEFVVDRMQARARQSRAGDLVGALQRARISAEVIVPLGRLVTSPQWRARDLMRSAADHTGRAEAALGPPFSVKGTDYCALRPSPRLRRGQQAVRALHAAEHRWRVMEPSGARPAGAGPAGGAGRVVDAVGPLAGLRVIDLTTAWAGPLAARSLAHLGAQVIKVDAPSHPDSWRGALDGGAPRHYPDGEPGRRPWNRCVLFNTQGQGKLSLGLDLKIAGAGEVFLRLADVSDILIANFTPGVLERLGIGYDALSARNPRLIVVEMPAFGPGGPDSGHQGMGKTMEGACGMAALMGYGDGAPVLTGPAYLDPIGGLSAVAATLAALHHRDATGRGSRVEIPQTEAGAHWIGEHVLLHAESGASSEPAGNRVSYAAPHDAYPCLGTDEWVAIAITDQVQWRALCAAMRRPDLGDSARYRTAAGRARDRREVDERIAEWTRQFGKHELAAMLQAVGVPAAPVNNGADVSADPVLLETGFIRSLEHSEAGRHAYPGLSYHLNRTPGGISRAAPCFGEHNDLVLRDILGLTSDQIAAMKRAGAVTDRPSAATGGSAAADSAHSDVAGRWEPSHLEGRRHAPPITKGSR